MKVQETKRANHKGSVYSKYSGVKAVYNVEEKNPQTAEFSTVLVASHWIYL